MFNIVNIYYSTGISEVILPLFGCLKDSCTVSGTLLDNYRDAGGYKLLTEAVLNVSF